MDNGPASEPLAANTLSPGKQPSANPPPGTIGSILVDSGRLSAEDAERVIASQHDVGTSFGETAVRMGLATPADVEYALAHQFSLPVLPGDSDAVDPEVVAAFSPSHDLSEQLRNLRDQIARFALKAEPPIRSIAIMGSEPGVGRSFIVANLATTFAQLGARTLVVDCDLENPRQHELFRVGNRSGLSSILAKRAQLNAVCAVKQLPGLAVLPAGPTPPNPHDLLARPMLVQLLRRCERDFHVVLIDTPVWSEDRSARIVAAAAGAAVLVVQLGRTGSRDATLVTQELAQANAKVLGVVINRPQKLRR